MSANLGRVLRLAPWLVLAAGCAAESAGDVPQSGSSRGGNHAAGNGGSPSGNAGTAPSGGSLSLGGAANDGGRAGGGAGGKSGSGGMPLSGGASAGGEQASGSGGTAGTATGGAGGAAACPAPVVAPGTMPLIDDFNHLGRAIPTHEGRSGVWDVWSLLPTADMSPKSANYQTTGADTDGYTHWTGNAIGGTNDWGPTLTVQLNAGCAYDASAYQGISFKLKGTATKLVSGASAAVPLKVMLWQPQGVPAKDAKGGACTALACYNHYSTFVNVPATWDTPVSVPFASLTQGTWTGTTPFAWNPKQLIAIQFQVEVDGSKGELATFDLSLDDLMFAK